MDPTFARSTSIANTIEGMLSHFSMAAMDSLLSFQAESGIRGDIVELGVFRGKSAAILAARLSDDEQLLLYDIANYFDRESLAKLDANLAFNVVSTADLSTKDFRNRKHSVRFCHIDASHMFVPTMHEMSLADFMLSENGILCLDDYTNLNYSQILAATFKYLFTKKTDLKIFLVTDEKAYLCRRSNLRLYSGFVLDHICGRMAERGADKTMIARTDDTPSYGAFYLRVRGDAETGVFYGPELYHQFYQIRDHYSLASRIVALHKAIARAPVARKIARVFGGRARRIDVPGNGKR